MKYFANQSPQVKKLEITSKIQYFDLISSDMKNVLIPERCKRFSLVP